MDDRELEARLRTHLHQRFDAAPIPAGLSAAIREGMTSAQTRKVGFAFRAPTLNLGWVTAAVAIAIGASLVWGSGSFGPATPGPSTTPIPTLQVIGERTFVLVPASGASPTAAERETANQVLMDRLAPLGLKATRSEQAGWIGVTLEQEGLPDEAIIQVLSATGDVEFVPLPKAAYEGVDTSTLVGQRLPDSLSPLFGNDGIASVKRGASEPQGIPTIDFTFTSAAAALFADYTTDHQGESLAITIDGAVMLVPITTAPITGGEVSVTGGNASPNPFRPDTTFDVAAAILVGGRLPESWAGLTVVKVLSQEDAVSAAKRFHPAGVVSGSFMAVMSRGSTLWPVWRVTITVSVLSGDELVTIDAVTGQPIR